MNKFSELSKLIDDFEKQVKVWEKSNPLLWKAVENLAVNYNYKLENAIVFNKNLRKICENGPKYILVADNPGMDEQKNENSCYLIGKAGQMTRNFFLNNGLVRDFDSEVAVLNKTCIHTKSTIDLKKLKPFKHLVDETQGFMADLAVDIQKTYGSKLWVIGCSELKEKGLFAPYLNQLKKRYSTDGFQLKENLFFYPHFSYGNFQKNLNTILLQKPELTIEKALKEASLKIF